MKNSNDINYNISLKKAVFLDRDGTLINDKNYLCNVEEIEILSGVVQGLKILQNNGFLLIVITNQSGVARGIFTEEELIKFNNYLKIMFIKQGVYLTDILYCPHHPDGIVDNYSINCDCRKPKTKLFWAAVNKYNIDLRESFAIGDRLSDCAICLESSCQGVIIKKNNNTEYVNYSKNIHSCNNFMDAVNLIMKGDYVV